MGLTWSSTCAPATPASSSAWTVRATFIGSPKPVSASTSAGRSVTRAICCERPATSVRVVRPMSGRPRSADSTAPDTYTPSKPLSWIRRADSGLNAPGSRSGSPVVAAASSAARNARRLSDGVTWLYSISAPLPRWSRRPRAW
ncbi:Uncharacterised protein [Mycobacteroides abscessus]|nr:Uncharacterised protein [Mycobacteroides abscessus]